MSGERLAPVKGAVLIAGPTASGKSALALGMAKRLGGAVINADSMQVYSTLRVVTARPSDADMGTAPHFLYGHVDPATPYSTGAWRRDVETILADGSLGTKRPIFVGGTGLYFRALAGGLADMPTVPPAIRDRWRARLDEEGPQALHRELERLDPRAATVLGHNDRQRIVRALEIAESTGRSILDWQATGSPPLIDPATATCLVLEPPRAELHARIEARFRAILADGASDEVRALLAKGIGASMPAMKAIGVAAIAAWDAGQIDRETATDRGIFATRQYAKRQSTWFRNQLGSEWLRIERADDIDVPDEFPSFRQI